jgi:serine/threonine protein phosphatase PrpC
MASTLSGGIVGVLRTPTFYVETEEQRRILSTFQKNTEDIQEEVHKSKTLCFSAQAYQKQHPDKTRKGIRDADATLGSPMILGVADGVSQIEDFGIDASMLPRELLRHCQDLGDNQLTPGYKTRQQDKYRGPIPLLKDAFEATEDTLGSTTATLALLDNSTKIHGKPHPMIAVITVGDCQLLVLRRTQGRGSRLASVFQTEMQRIDGHAQTPLQIARINEKIDPAFHDDITVEVIEKGSAVHCVSAYEGDIIVMGTDGVFDNLHCQEVTDICNHVLQPNMKGDLPTSLLKSLGQQIVAASHAKTVRGPHGMLPETPIGRGGKVDDTAVVVAEVVEWTQGRAEEHAKSRPRPNVGLFGNLFSSCACSGGDVGNDVEEVSEESDES